MPKHFLVIAAVLMSFSIGACAGIKPVEMETGTGLVYGNLLIDGKTLPDDIIFYEFGKVYAPPFVSPPTAHIYSNGNFFFENLKPAKYYLAFFKSGRELFTIYSFDNRKEVTKHLHEVRPGGLVYLGSYNATVTENPLIGTGKFSFEKVAGPGEKVILEHLLEVMKGKGWDKLIKKKVSMLKK